MIRILLDSSADFSAQEAKERNLELVSINITMNGKKLFGWCRYYQRRIL